MARYTEQSAAFAVAKAPSFSEGHKCASDRCPSRSAIFLRMHGKDRKAKIVATACSCTRSRRPSVCTYARRPVREYYEKATRQRVTGDLLIQQLDAAWTTWPSVWAFAISRRQARQVVRHGHVEVNGRK